MKKNVSVTLDIELHKAFQEFTKANGMNVSNRLEILMREDLKKNGKDIDFVNKA